MGDRPATVRWFEIFNLAGLVLSTVLAIARGDGIVGDIVFGALFAWWILAITRKGNLTARALLTVVEIAVPIFLAIALWRFPEIWREAGVRWEDIGSVRRVWIAFNWIGGYLILLLIWSPSASRWMQAQEQIKMAAARERRNSASPD